MKEVSGLVRIPASPKPLGGDPGNVSTVVHGRSDGNGSEFLFHSTNELLGGRGRGSLELKENNRRRNDISREKCVLNNLSCADFLFQYV